ncbi:hypothetical protein P7K49_035421, partial [Saguinus oedipus]
MEKQKLLYQQARLHDRGAAEMVLQTISASKGRPRYKTTLFTHTNRAATLQDNFIYTRRRQAVILVYENDVRISENIKSGLLSCQMNSGAEKMLDYLKEKKDVGFFQSLAGLMQSCSVLDLNAFERQNKAEGLGMVFRAHVENLEPLPTSGHITCLPPASLQSPKRFSAKISKISRNERTLCPKPDFPKRLKKQHLLVMSLLQNLRLREHELSTEKINLLYLNLLHPSPLSLLSQVSSNDNNRTNRSLSRLKISDQHNFLYGNRNVFIKQLHPSLCLVSHDGNRRPDSSPPSPLPSSHHSAICREKVLQDDEFTCDLFRFLQLLCEGHNSDFQNYLRTQTGNNTTVNIIISTVDYLLRVQSEHLTLLMDKYALVLMNPYSYEVQGHQMESISDFYWYYSGKDVIDEQGQRNFSKAIQVAKQVFNTLTEYIQPGASSFSHD